MIALAVDMDPAICREMFNHPNILWRRKTYLVRKIIRKGLQQLESHRPYVELIYKPKWNSFSEGAAPLSQDGYFFVENFLVESDYEVLKSNWPKTRFFTPVMPNDDHKTSEKGLYCQHGKPRFDVNRNPVIWSLYCMFMSEEFRNQVTEVCGDGIEREPYHLLIQNSFWGSGLAPHRDSHVDGVKSKINFIYFVDANGFGWDAGGTSILTKNNFEKPIFTPQNLKNTCLFYYSESVKFHGFPMMKFRKFRKNVISHFCAS